MTYGYSVAATEHMPRARIAHVIISLGVGGAERMLVGVAAATDRTAFESLIVTLGPPGPLAEEARARGIVVRSLDATRGLGVALLPFRLRRVLRQEQIEVVQTWMYHADLLGGAAARLAGIPVTWGIQAGASVGTRRSTAAVRWLCARLSRRLPSEIICCAETSRRVHRALGYADRMSVVPNACDTSVFRPDPIARAAIRAELGLTDERLVGMVARADPLKDHESLIRAVGALSGDLADVHLVLVGDGMDVDNVPIMRAVREAGLQHRCHLLGPRKDVSALNAALDVFVLSSRSEGLPLVLPEAMACGIPCVATDVGDCRDVLAAPDRVVPVGDVAALATALTKVLTLNVEQREALGRAARRRVEERYSLDVAASAYAAAWHRALRHSPRSADR